MKGVCPPWPRCCLLALVVLLAGAGPAAAKSYRALQVDVHAELRRDRSLAVTEAITYRFEEGTFTEVYRDVPLRSSDGVADVVASMNGAPLGEGTGAGHVEIEAGSRRLRVRWHFNPLSGEHTFELRYRLLGVVTQGRDEDLLEWHVLPDERRYHIDAMEARIVLPPGAVPTPELTVGPSSVTLARADDGLALAATDLARNRDVRIRLPMTGGAFVPEVPAWQGQRAMRLARGPWMIGVAALVIVAGLGWLAVFRSAWRVDAGPAHDSRITYPPDPLLPIGIAARLGGTSAAGQALATLFELAHRRIVHVYEVTTRGGRRRGFMVRLGTQVPALTEPERALTDLAFPAGPKDREIALLVLQRRLSGRLGLFTAAIDAEMRQRGLLDPDRAEARRTLTRATLAALAVALASIGLAIALLPAFGPWAMLLPASGSIVVLALAVARSTFSVLTRTGTREARRWKAFWAYLRDVGKGKTGDPAAVQHEWLPYLVAASAAGAWAKQVRGHAATLPVPDWFRAAAQSADERSAAFLALLSSTAASTGAGVHAGGGGGSGVAGGGTSGAR